MTKIFAHRGYSKVYPENSKKAFKKAYEHGADGIELDVQLTKDHQIIVMHDTTIDRTTKQSGYVKDFTLKEITSIQLKGSGRFINKMFVPSLQEVMEWIKDKNMMLNIEIKTDTNGILENVLMDMINKFNYPEKIIISSFNINVLKYFEAHNPLIHTALLYKRYIDSPWKLIESHGINAVHPNVKYLSKSYIKILIDNNLPSRVYTVNRETDLIYYLEAGVDSIITDNVELAVKLKNEYNK